MKKIYAAVIPPGGWSDKFTFSPGVKAGNLLYISGMTSADEKGVLIGPGDIVRQTEYIFEKMGRILAAAGVQVAGLIRPGALIEIKAIAVLDQEPG